jgi:hypothetical protein
VEASSAIQQTGASWTVSVPWGMVETNSQILVKAMNMTEFDRTPEGIIYRDLRLYMQMHHVSVIN